MDEATLLLTATIAIGRTANVVLRDAEARLDQYLGALLLWIDSGAFRRLSFCENSGFAFDFAPLVAYAAEKGVSLEILRLSVDAERVARQGKGYGEGEILREAFARSAVLARSQSVWKITGRLYAAAAAELLRRHDGDANVFFSQDDDDRRRLVWARLLRRRAPCFVRTEIFKVQPQFYAQYLAKAHETVSDAPGQWLEHAFAGAVVRAPRRGCKIVSLATADLVGMSASSGQGYGSKTFASESPDLPARIAAFRERGRAAQSASG